MNNKEKFNIFLNFLVIFLCGLNMGNAYTEGYMTLNAIFYILFLGYIGLLGYTIKNIKNMEEIKDED